MTYLQYPGALSCLTRVMFAFSCCGCEVWKGPVRKTTLHRAFECGGSGNGGACCLSVLIVGYSLKLFQGMHVSLVGGGWLISEVAAFISLGALSSLWDAFCVFHHLLARQNWPGFRLCLRVWGCSPSRRHPRPSCVSGEPSVEEKGARQPLQGPRSSVLL